MHKSKKDDQLFQKVEAIVGWLMEKKALDVIGLDIREYSSITEVLVIASGVNIKHNQALADWLLDKVAEMGWEYMGMEGYKLGNWILIDLNEIIVHIFLDEVRKFYNLEGLWRGANRVPLKTKEQEMAHEDV